MKKQFLALGWPLPIPSHNMKPVLLDMCKDNELLDSWILEGVMDADDRQSQLVQSVVRRLRTDAPMLMPQEIILKMIAKVLSEMHPMSRLNNAQAHYPQMVAGIRERWWKEVDLTTMVG